MGKRRPLRNTGSSKVNRMQESDNASSRRRDVENEEKKDNEEKEEKNSPSEDDDEEDDDEDENESLFAHKNNEIMNMTFEFNDMKEPYCYGVAKMLEYVLPNHEALSIGDVIANQGEVGTAIVCEEGDDVFAYASIVPLSNLLAGPSYFVKMYEELHHAVSQLGPGEGQSELNSCLSGANQDKTGVYFHGRYTNLPIQLIAPLHRNLKEDLQWIISQPSSPSSFLQIQHLLMILPCSHESSQQLKKGSCRNVTGSSSVPLANFEDDIFFNHSTCSIQMHFTKSSSDCCVILLPLHKVERCIEEINQLAPSS